MVTLQLKVMELSLVLRDTGVKATLLKGHFLPFPVSLLHTDRLLLYMIHRRDILSFNDVIYVSELSLLETNNWRGRSLLHQRWGLSGRGGFLLIIHSENKKQNNFRVGDFVREKV